MTLPWFVKCPKCGQPAENFIDNPPGRWTSYVCRGIHGCGNRFRVRYDDPNYKGTWPYCGGKV